MGCKCAGLPTSRGPTLSIRRAFRTSRHSLKDAKAAAAEIVGTPYSSLTIGVPKESFGGEKRVALVPAAVANLCKKGFNINVQDGAGMESQFRNIDYEAAGPLPRRPVRAHLAGLADGPARAGGGGGDAAVR